MTNDSGGFIKIKIKFLIVYVDFLSLHSSGHGWHIIDMQYLNNSTPFIARGLKIAASFRSFHKIFQLNESIYDYSDVAPYFRIFQ